MMKVELNYAEIYRAAEAGLMRRVKAMQDKQTQYGSGASWTEDIEGALGECAVAKALNIYWAGMGIKNGGDVGELQVKTTRLKNGRLIVKKENESNARYILVVGEMGEYELKGWLWGHEAKQPEYWVEKSAKIWHPAYFVPQDKLKSVEELA